MFLRKMTRFFHFSLTHQEYEIVEAEDIFTGCESAAPWPRIRPLLPLRPSHPLRPSVYLFIIPEYYVTKEESYRSGTWTFSQKAQICAQLNPFRSNN